ncbi:hypothetical protein [Neobacillus soli]|uniref:hypothetical protein n=1 Tax=Neobacillus soli TaxID=220688 RepID=UPI000AABE9DE|nr:hypothetical protein [Neobacillus soli]
MPKLQNNNERQLDQSATQPGSGSKYHEKHAGNVTGYGEMDENAKTLTNTTKDSSLT